MYVLSCLKLRGVKLGRREGNGGRGWKGNWKAVETHKLDHSRKIVIRMGKLNLERGVGRKNGAGLFTGACLRGQLRRVRGVLRRKRRRIMVRERRGEEMAISHLMQWEGC
jgi:hypothetical protein